MGIQVNMHEAKTRLSELVSASERGEEVVLARAGNPIVRLVPVTPEPVRDRDAIRAERLAWMGSFRGALVDPDVFAQPAYADEELEEFSANLIDPRIENPA